MSDKESPGGAGTPRGADHEGMHFMAKDRIARNALPDEVKRMILRESVARYRNELTDDEERILLLDRIRRIRRQLRLV